MNKGYIVRLSDQQRQVCREVIKKRKGSSQEVRRARILLQADADGPNWTDARIADAYDRCVQTIRNVRKRLVSEGFETALKRKVWESPPRLLHGEKEAKLIALLRGKPPAGHDQWSLRILARELVAWEVVESISHETVRQTLRKHSPVTPRHADAIPAEPFRPETRALQKASNLEICEFSGQTPQSAIALIASARKRFQEDSSRHAPPCRPLG